MKNLTEYILKPNLKTSLVVESRAECVKELKELGIKNIQFAEYNNENGECLFMSKFGDPEKYVNSWSKKLQELNWEKIDNKDYPEHDTKYHQPMYAKPVIYRKDNWDCLMFMRYGYDLDGVNIAFKKNNIK